MQQSLLRELGARRGPLQKQVTLDRTLAPRDALTLAGSLASELEAAEAVALAVPLYNLGVSQHFKIWVGLVIAGAPWAV
ncbi:MULTISPECIES: hypothetical protein [unclassified Streptomyces]|uniref:hypothetical protein n=1 Tax=unclassified Streptomyces TaxID=2593676 RepID=UPI00386B20FA